MITLVKTGAILRTDEYYIRHIFSGLDEVIFPISIWDPDYPTINEEAHIICNGQTYLVKAIDGGGENATVKCQIDIDALKANMFINYNNNSATPYSTVAGVLPGGWTCVDNTLITTKRTIIFDGATAFTVIQRVCEVWDITVMYNTALKQVILINPATYQPMGAFASRDLNLKSIQYKGKSTDFVTRLYAYGKEGLTFESINDGKPYVDNQAYSQKIISAYWSDERYTVMENLLTDAIEKLADMANPVRSYACSVVDLAATNPDMYGFEDFSMFSVVTLMDDTKNTAVDHQVVEYWEYPYYPNKNVVTLSTATPRITTQVAALENAFSDPNSDFQQQMQAAIQAATSQILAGTGGYVVLNTNEVGRIYEILIMDQPSTETAQKLWRWNLGGLGYSNTGVNGDYTTAITQDGAIVANFITTGVLNAANITVQNLSANSIVSGTLESVDQRTYFDLDNGEIVTEVVELGHTYQIKMALGKIAFYYDGTQTGYVDGSTSQSAIKASIGIFDNVSATGAITTDQEILIQSGANAFSLPIVLTGTWANATVDGSYTVAFGQTMPSVPTVMLTLDNVRGGNAHLMGSPYTTSITKNGFTFSLPPATDVGATVANVNWVAFVTP